MKEKYGKGRTGARRYVDIWPAALVLMFAGLILLPAHIRQPVLRQWMSDQLAFANYLMAGTTVLLLLWKRDLTKAEAGLCVLWCLLLIPWNLSNAGRPFSRTASSFFNNWFPLFLILQRIEPDNPEKRERILGRALLVFDLFIILLLGIGLYEKFSGQELLRTVYSLMKARGLKNSEFKYYFRLGGGGDARFFSFWGHPLTNAVLFNAFFVLNDLYYGSIRKPYPRLLFFLAALTGSAFLCVGKTASVVLILCFLIGARNRLRWIPVYALGGAGLYFSGFLDRLIRRFTSGSLTSGRLETLARYLEEGIYPLQFWKGYGSNTVFTADMKHLKAAFEFPLLMFGMDYGMLFSLIFIGSVFGYYSFRLLQKRAVAGWLELSLLFAQLNVYNAMSLRNQDVCWWMAVIVMFAISCVSLSQEDSEPAS